MMRYTRVKTLADKLEDLCHWFRQQQHVAVAYSGGVDSALLLYLGTRIIGPSNCYGFFADTSLIGEFSRSSAFEFANQYNCKVHSVPIDPFSFPLFANNNANRCYICKKSTYSLFLDQLEENFILVDGTNLDDLRKDRPGYKALGELAVSTPYLDCNISKFDIRSLSYHLGLNSWSRLSESCLATRVKQETFIVKENLQRIDSIEEDLRHIGLNGCRVQPRDGSFLLTVSTGQLKQTLDNDILKQIRVLAKSYDFTKVFLDLFEREGILPSLLDYIGFEANIAPQKQFSQYFNNLSG